MTKDDQYKQIFKQAKDNPAVQGLALVGSRGKGSVTKHSDYDIYLIVSENFMEEARKQFPSLRSPHKFDITIHTLASFKEYAAWGSLSEWDRYNFKYVKAQFDNTGQFQELIDQKGCIPTEHLEEATRSYLDNYIYYFYRSIKDHRDGSAFSSLLHAAESMPYLIAFIFAIEGRLRPFNKYIEWELEKHPLEFLPWDKDDFVHNMKSILQSGDIKVQKEVFDKICQLANEKGCAEEINGWNGCYLG